MNDYTLADRLAALLADAPQTIRQYVIQDADTFGDSVRWTRNFFTHYKEEDRPKAAHGVALLNLTDQMRWLLAGLLLKRLGLPVDQVEAILQRNGRLRRAAGWH